MFQNRMYTNAKGGDPVSGSLPSFQQQGGRGLLSSPPELQKSIYRFPQGQAPNFNQLGSRLSQGIQQGQQWGSVDPSSQGKTGSMNNMQQAAPQTPVNQNQQWGSAPMAPQAMTPRQETRQRFLERQGRAPMNAGSPNVSGGFMVGKQAPQGYNMQQAAPQVPSAIPSYYKR